VNIADLFINLGVKGADKTVNALAVTKKGVGDLASTSIEAKAALVGAFYALEQLTAASGHAGTEFTQFELLTGQSAQTLQTWQNAARQAGESADDLKSSFMSVQSGISNMLLNGTAPQGLAMMAKYSKDFDPTKVRDTFYMMTKGVEAIKNMSAKDLANPLMESMGFTKTFIASARSGAFDPSKMKAAEKMNHYSPGEVKNLHQADVAWMNLGDTFQKAVGHFNAKEGVNLVKQITPLVGQVLKLVEAFEKLAEKLKIFQVIGKVFEGWTSIFSLVGKGVDSVTGAVGDKAKTKELVGSVGEFFKGIPAVVGAMKDDLISKAANNPSLNIPPSEMIHTLIHGNDLSNVSKSVSPRSPAATSKVVNQHNNVQQTNHFHESKTPGKDAAHELKRQVKKVVQEIPLQAN